MDPKYMPVVNGLFAREGGYIVPPDEPVMILRGKDPFALAAIRAYIDGHECEKHKASAAERLAAFENFQAANPDRVGVDCTRKPE